MTEPKMARGLAARLKKGRTAAEVLAEKSNNLSEALTRAEQTVAGLRLGVSASLLLYIDELDSTETYLRFERFEGRWCFTIASGRPDLDNWSTTPLLKASRSRRMEAARKLPELLDALLERTEAEIAEVVESTLAVENFIAELREAQS